MLCSLIVLLSLSLGLAASSERHPSRWVLHERRSQIPAGWRFSRKHHASAIIPLRVALVQSNLKKIDEFLNDVSHPDSPNYGKHWSAAKVASTFAPSREAVDAVRDWLVESGVDPRRIKLSGSKGWLEFRASVQEAEDLFQTDYNVYEHDTGVEHVACEGYHLPGHLSGHVDFVYPTVHFDARLPKRSIDGVKPHALGASRPGSGLKISEEVVDQIGDCDTYITPECLRALYNFRYEPVAADKNSFGVVEYSPQTYLQDDLDLFARNFSSDLVGVSPQTVFIDGNASVSFNTTKYLYNQLEADLDLEYAMNLVTKKQPVTLYQVGDITEGESFNNFLDAFDSSYCTGDNSTIDGVYPDNQPGGYDGPEACGTIKPANVISTSYSYDEADLAVKYATRQCAEYGKLGLLGVTFLFASGDDGVAGNFGWCLNPDGIQNETGKIFNPGFPSTCPYVTSVGATQVSPGQTVHDPESACVERIQTGGGFSNYFSLPEYQKDAVTSYLCEYPPNYPSDIWNSTGKSRAYPDLAANGAHYVVAADGKTHRVYGTSASTPVVGAMLAMINDARLAVGKSPVGFINPTIYRPDFRSAFNDITNGSNPGCGTLGFNTSKGWDPVTGLGTLNFGKLLAKWLELP